MRIGIYPGSFDPVTLGHLDVVERASKLFDRLIVAVMHNGAKRPSFSCEERMEFLRRTTTHLSNVEIDGTDDLLAEYARRKNACAIVKGLRAVSDFEYEFQMAGMNRYLLPDVETMFMTPSDQYQFISGTIVREIAHLGGDVSKFVFPSVEAAVKRKFAQNQ